MSEALWYVSSFAFTAHQYTVISVLQSAPKILIQIVITGTQIFGKALLEAARQAAKSMAPFGDSCDFY